MKTKVMWHVSRSASLAKTILQGTVNRKRRGRQRKRWEGYIKEWTGMDFASSTRAAESKTRWEKMTFQTVQIKMRCPICIQIFCLYSLDFQHEIAKKNSFLNFADKIFVNCLFFFSSTFRVNSFFISTRDENS